jgi:hypothetical protein
MSYARSRRPRRMNVRPAYAFVMLSHVTHANAVKRTVYVSIKSNIPVVDIVAKPVFHGLTEVPCPHVLKGRVLD